MPGFPLSFLTDQILNINTDSGNITDLKEANTKALLDMLKGLSNGETFIAKVMSADENSYVIQTENNITINAKSREGVTLTPGKNVIFEVNKFSNDTFSLRPLNTNINTEMTSMSALKEAGIPINNRSLEMTERLMEYGSPIDRNSLLESYREVVMNPTAPVKYIVDLEKMEIPITPRNLVSYEAYLNMENSLWEGILDISDKLFDSFSNSNMNTNNDFDFFSKVLAFIDETNETLPIEERSNLLDDLANNLREFQKVSKTGSANAEGFENLWQNIADLNESEIDSFMKPSNQSFQRSAVEIKDTFFAKTELKEAFKNIIEKTFAEHFSLPVEENIDKPAVKDLYKRLFLETGKLTKAIEELGAKDSPVGISVSNLSSGIDFMNSLNNFIPYVQIPFRSEGNVKAGELYVFKDRSKALSKDGELSAFLHLDTKNLGATDVYIKMKDFRVSTNFCLENEESLRFIEENIGLLNKRMDEKGYNLSFNAQVLENRKTPMEIVMEESFSKLLIGTTSFDARV